MHFKNETLSFTHFSLQPSTDHFTHSDCRLGNSRLKKYLRSKSWVWIEHVLGCGMACHTAHVAWIRCHVHESGRRGCIFKIRAEGQRQKLGWLVWKYAYYVPVCVLSGLPRHKPIISFFFSSSCISVIATQYPRFLIAMVILFPVVINETESRIHANTYTTA